MDFPNANEYDITWHLIPTANMLQFAKADAHRIDDQGLFNTKIEARYSQAQTTGGDEPIYQSETRYAQTTGVMGDHARQAKQHKIRSLDARSGWVDSANCSSRCRHDWGSCRYEL